MMKLIADVLNIIFSFNEIYWLYQWVNLLVQKKGRFVTANGRKSKILEIILYATYVITVFALNSITLTSPYTMLVIMIQNFLAVLWFWKSDVIQALAVIGGYFFAMFLVGNVEISITGMIGGDALIQATTSEIGTARVVYMIIGGTIWYAVNAFLVGYARKKGIQQQSMKYIAGISVVGIIGSAFLGTFMLNRFGFQINTTWYLFLGAMLAVIFCCYYAMRRKDIQVRMSLLEAE